MIIVRYLDAHVLGGYTFLMENYRDGDKICIFGALLFREWRCFLSPVGFSRGAYIARYGCVNAKHWSYLTHL